jgi:hypothetical protein
MGKIGKRGKKEGGSRSWGVAKGGKPVWKCVGVGGEAECNNHGEKRG